jgi:hypothetical protein
MCLYSLLEGRRFWGDVLPVVGMESFLSWLTATGEFHFLCILGVPIMNQPLSQTFRESFESFLITREIVFFLSTWLPVHSFPQHCQRCHKDCFNALCVLYWHSLYVVFVLICFISLKTDITWNCWKKDWKCSHSKWVWFLDIAILWRQSSSSDSWSKGPDWYTWVQSSGRMEWLLWVRIL